MIIVFDAQCLLCSGWVKFLLKHDHDERIQFTSDQSSTGQQLLLAAGLDPNNLDTFLVIDGGQASLYSMAVIRILAKLGWPWCLICVGWLIPSPIRDAIYRWVARHRYQFFGRSETCMVPSVAMAHRFLQ